MENDTYAVIELQSNGASLGIIKSAHTSWNDALSKFYNTMISIAQSNIPEHTCVILDKVGNVRKIETIYHEVAEK